VKLSNE